MLLFSGLVWVESWVLSGVFCFPAIHPKAVAGGFRDGATALLKLPITAYLLFTSVSQITPTVTLPFLGCSVIVVSWLGVSKFRDSCDGHS